MIIDECLLVFTHSQAEPAPARLPSRPSKVKRAPAPIVSETLPPPLAAMHSIDELALIADVDLMPVMQTTQRTRAPTSMAARPRLGRMRAPIAPREPEPKSRKSRASRAKTAPAPEPRLPRREARVTTTVTFKTLIERLITPDVRMKTRALEIAESEIRSEPVSAIHTAIRIVLQATLDLGRPYDTNMLGATFGVARNIVMQALRKHYEDFVEQSRFVEALFVPTYLWLYGCPPTDAARVIQAIELSGTAEPGCRSVFAIARDFVILYVSEVVHKGGEARAELTGLSSVSHVMAGIELAEEVPKCFLEMTNAFLYRARMTGRHLMKAKPELIRSRGGTIGGLF